MRSDRKARCPSQRTASPPCPQTATAKGTELQHSSFLRTAQSLNGERAVPPADTPQEPTASPLWSGPWDVSSCPHPQLKLPSLSQSLPLGLLDPSPETPIDRPASGQPQFFLFQFQFLLILEALISEMYGIIGLYCSAIYLCLSLCAGLILLSLESQEKRMPS